MDNKLRECLSDMTDEDFFELKRNMEISFDLRDMQRGEFGFTEAEIMKRLDFTQYDLLYVFNGAFDFTTRHLAIIDVMKEEYEYFNTDPFGDDKEEVEEQADMADRDIPDGMNYGTLGDDRSDVIYLGGSRKLTEEEEKALEEEDKEDIKESHVETIEEISARLNKEYLARQQSKPQENTDASIVNFN